MLRWIILPAVGLWAAFFGIAAAVVTGKAAEIPWEDSTAKPTSDVLTQPQRKAFKWFDSLGYPSLGDRQFVRVAFGFWREDRDFQPQAQHRFAFLLKSDAKEFTILTLDLDVRTFKFTPPDTPPYKRVGYDKADLKAEVAAYLKALQPVTERTQPEISWQYRETWHLHPELSEAATVFVLARACAAAGLEAESRDLLDFAEEYARRPPNEKRTFREVIAEHLAYTHAWRAVLAFEDLEVGRPELLARFQQLIRRFPTSAHIEGARETAALLQQMIREDEEHAKRAKPWDKMTTQERVAELIFRLRDQSGHQMSAPGHCSVFGDPRGEKSPAHQLAAIGYDAVPQLIDALDDHRFTRAVGCHRYHYYSHFVLRVGDAACAVLEHIAGRTFFYRRGTTSEMIAEDAAGEVKQAVREWWKESQEKGEKRMLIEAVERADEYSSQQAQRLRQRYPDAALAAMIRGAREAQDRWRRQGMIYEIGEIEGTSPVSFLREEMLQSPLLGCRVAAARELWKRKHPEAVPAMIEEWKKRLPASDDILASGEHLTEFLVRSGSAEAIRTLAERVGKLPLNARVRIVASFGPPGSPNTYGAGGPAWIAPVNDGAEQQPLQRAVEELLVRALDDTEQRTGMRHNWGGKVFSDPRTCDIAGHVLWLRWPKKYAFDISASTAVRDAQRTAMKKAWQEQRGQPPVDPPTPR